MGQRVDLSFQVQGILPVANGGMGSLTGMAFADSETPSGAVNGSNTVFTLAFSPNPPLSLLFVKAGAIQIQGIDYTLAGASVTTTAPPVSGAVLRAWYRYVQNAWVIRESMNLSDSLVTNFLSFNKFAESMTLTEAFAQQLIIPSYQAETLVQSDGVAILFGNQFLESPVDQLVMTEGIAIWFGNNFGENLSLSDGIAIKKDVQFLESPSDTLIMADAVAKTLA